MTYNNLSDDPELVTRRRELVKNAAKTLNAAQMIDFNQTSNTFTITDLGRIAAKYYIRHASIETFNKLFKEKMTEAYVLSMISRSTEASLRLVVSSVPPLIILILSLPKFKFGKLNWKN